jgi:serine/threonine protein kinase/tetratricopeptide (TPR) repeat protein
MTERSIFLAVLEIDDLAERAAYLDRACAGDPDLRAQVEQLLVAHEASGTFMGRPAPDRLAATTDQPCPTEGPGTIIGSYKLLEQMGEGGFGVVFLAEQTQPVRRKVALKMLKPGMDTRQVVARFEAERQALALMDHPNIAKVFDGSATPAGRPYFVMELVKGVPITEFCDQNHLTPRQRLELFVSVCAAVQHAHQKGIIHRDLKPSNVLVSRHDTTPVVKVIDFGVAKALGQELTDKTLFTGIAQMIGTPLYMSPEQAGMSDLDVDTRSDIYSLGVLLYELLTGTTPFTKDRFKQAGYDEIRRIIREEEPPRPSTRLAESKDTLVSISAQRQMEPARLTRLLRGELDWVVMKALEKDRNRRYETANGFAMDVQRYLADEPVLACPPSAGYRLRKFVRRNKAALTMASVVALAGLLVAGSIGWMAWNRTAREKQVAQELATRRGVVKEFLGESDRHVQAGNWQLALAEVRRAQAALKSGSVGEDVDQQVAERLKDLQMVGDLEELAAGSWDPDRKETATYSTLFRDYGIDVDVLPADEAAARIWERAIGNFLVGALDYWATQYGRGWSWPRDHVKEKQLDRHLLAITRAADPDEFRNQIRDALAQEDAATLVKLADSVRTTELSPAAATLLANALVRIGRNRGKAVMILRQVQARHPDDLELTSALATYLEKDPKTLLDAIRYFQAAVALRPRSLGLLANLAGVLDNACRSDEALFILQRAAEVHPRNAHAQYNWGYALLQAGRLTEAVAVLKETIRLQEDMAVAHNDLGFV